MGYRIMTYTSKNEFFVIDVTKSQVNSIDLKKNNLNGAGSAKFYPT